MLEAMKVPLENDLGRKEAENERYELQYKKNPAKEPQTQGFKGLRAGFYPNKENPGRNNRDN